MRVGGHSSARPKAYTLGPRLWAAACRPYVSKVFTYTPYTPYTPFTSFYTLTPFLPVNNLPGRISWTMAAFPERQALAHRCTVSNDNGTLHRHTNNTKKHRTDTGRARECHGLCPAFESLNSTAMTLPDAPVGNTPHGLGHRPPSHAKEDTSMSMPKTMGGV